MHSYFEAAAGAGGHDDDERRLSFPPPAPLHSPGEEIDGSRLLGEIVRTLEATNLEAAAPLAASQSTLDSHCERPSEMSSGYRSRGHLSSETVGGGGAAAAAATGAEPMSPRRGHAVHASRPSGRAAARRWCASSFIAPPPQRGGRRAVAAQVRAVPAQTLRKATRGDRQLHLR
ncbi:hypothetical protein EVAR_98933_1 [Eumeta japonica]|uniref:Uncharacterized protein n=1 Tax=Eumeta variegata TaxID=151549 RepID=A0A4C2A121_EUMVA|nr:hypothetical protein EVAR_98933_1 [Eumeta japonica]